VTNGRAGRVVRVVRVVRVGRTFALPSSGFAAAIGAVALSAAAAASSGAQPATDSLLDRAAGRIAAGRPLRAAFEQTLTNPDIRESKTSRGEFTQNGASRFSFRFTDPAGDAIVADGTSLWIYLPSSARGQVLKLPIAQGAQLDLLSQLLTTPRTTYQIATKGRENLDGQAAVVVQLTPRLPDAPFMRATLWIDPGEAFVRQIEAVEPSGLIRRIRFRDIRADVELPANALTFVLPAQVKVIDASGLLGRPPVPPDQR